MTDQNCDQSDAAFRETTVAPPVVFETRLMTAEELDTDGTIVLDRDSIEPEENSFFGVEMELADLDAMEGSADESRCGFIPGYSILGSLGQGGMGIVYQAIQERLQRVVALKVLRPNRECNAESIEQFKREAMAIARLNHPNIVTAYDYGEADGRFYLAIEYVEGRDGAELIARDGYIAEREAIGLIRDAVLGLSHALSHDIIHRDVKPANLMLTSHAAQDASGGALTGRLKVTDLGLAQIRENAEQAHEYTKEAGQIVGTPCYMPPEQALGNEVDFRGDIYSLGATLFHFLTGIKPFDSSSIYETLSLKKHGRIPHPQDLIESISDDTVLVLDRMMARDRSNRYQSYEELLLDLIALLAGRKPATATLAHDDSSIEKAQIRRSLLRRHRADAATPLAFRLRLVAPPQDHKKRWAKKIIAYATAIGAGFALAWLLL